MLRVGDLDKSLAFYTEVLNMKLLRRKDYPDGRFTLAFVGYGEERDTTSWLGNELQKEAFNELFKVQPLVRKKKNADLIEDYSRLQGSEHFYFMRTKLFSGADYHKYLLPYDSPYEAFINYMNVLSDFIERVKN